MAKKLTAEDADRPNDPQAIFKKHLDAILPLQGELQSAQQAQSAAQGRYRAAIKAAKKDGVDDVALLEFLKLRKLEPDEVTRRFKALNEMLLWGNVPVGTQLGMFDDGKSVATTLEDAASGFSDTGPERMTDKSMVAIEADGHTAFINNVAFGDCPYPQDTIAGQKWMSGWRLAEQQAIDKAKAEAAGSDGAPAAGKKGRGKRIKAPATAPEHPDLPPAA